MRPFTKKSRLQRLLETVDDSLDLPSGGRRLSLRGAGSGIGAVADLSAKQAAKAGLVVGGLAGLTAASAGISALRRTRGGRDDS